MLPLSNQLTNTHNWHSTLDPFKLLPYVAPLFESEDVDCYCAKVKGKCSVCELNESEARENTPNKKKRRRPSTSDEEDEEYDSSSDEEDEEDEEYDSTDEQ